jgi:radical SAM superfamily enzyme YgiQ (UPF0313 family)
MSKNKKVLFANPSLWTEYSVPRYGLGMLSAVLGNRGHTVKVADYTLTPNTPPIDKIFRDFQPDVFCVSMFSATKKLAEQMIEDIRSINKTIPILCGGPHISVAPDELAVNKNVDYVIVGEAEGVICDIVENASRQESPVTVPRPPLPDIDSLPFPDFRTFIGYEEMQTYPLLTTRGCPYDCNYCAVGLVGSKKYRTRRIELIIEELKLAYKRYNAKSLYLTDDSFNINIQRGKDLLRTILETRAKGDFNFILTTEDFRADKVDDELLSLLKALGADKVWIGVESADEEVFNAINKGESLNEIRKACKLSKKHGMRLLLNFIVGLPGDSMEKTYTSIRFARKFRAYGAVWYLFVAFKGTPAYKWFKENGFVTEGEYPPVHTHNFFGIPAPNAWTPDFSREERLDVWKLANIITAQVPFWPNFKLLYRIWWEYNVPWDIIASYPLFRLYKLKRWLFLLKLLFSSPRLFLNKVSTALAIKVLRRRVRKST